jgi:hypothetical protein
MSYLHVGARYYSPTLGRFLQRDPIGISGGLGTYQYVRNVPTAAIDPSGLIIYDTQVLPEVLESIYGSNRNGSNRNPKGPLDVMEQVYRNGTRKNKSDKWMHFVTSCRITAECGGGFLYLLPASAMKEGHDMLGGSDPVDSFGDMLANTAGWIMGPGAAVFGDSCEAMADDLGL